MSINIQSVFEQMAHEMRLLLDPLVNACESPDRLFAFFAERGWRLEGLLKADMTPIATAVDAVRTDLGSLSAAPQVDSLDDIAKLLAAFGNVFEKIRKLERSISGLAAPGIEATLADELAADLVEYLVLWYAAARAPALVQIARVLTIVDEQLAPVLASPTGDVLRLPLYRPTLRLQNLAPLLRNPTSHLKRAYVPQGSIVTGADARTFAETLFPRITILAYALGGTARAGLSGAPTADFLDPANEPLQRMMTLLFQVGPTGPAISDDSPGAQAGVGATIAVVPANGTASFGPQGPGLEIDPLGVLTFEMPLGRWMLNIQAVGQVGKLFVSEMAVRFANPTTSSIDLVIALARDREQKLAFSIGPASGTRLEVGSFRLSGEGHFHGKDPEFGALVEVGSAAFVIAKGDGDGFLQKILPKDGIRLDFDLAVGWSNQKGLYFKGGAGLEATLPVNIDLFGVIKIDSVYLALQAKEDSKTKESAIQAVTATTVKVQLGPVSAVVERFGLQATLSFPEKGGNLGVANLDLGFKPPSGVSLTIKAPVVTGGGYLYFDVEKEQYAGVLQLEIAEKISLSAVGLITTRMPDGKPGFSLLVIISARFDPGIQLGYGFTLNGLGGLLGVNRTANAEVLRDGLCRDALGSMLFPQNIVKNAPQIVSNLSTIFPPAPDRFLFGPMAILGWGGSPPLVSLELGIILELPEPVRLMILGRLRVTLPNTAGDGQPQTPIIKLQLDSLGLIDFGSGDISLDAVMYDSTIGPFAVTGQMALRANFGTQPKFLLSVGGFHPAFQAPAGFPSVERVAFTLAKKDGDVEVRLQMSAYFALTSNTVQLGSRLDLYVHLGIFEVIGLLAFDALIQFQPFGLMASFEAMVVVKASGQVLLGIRLRVNLTGPSPWHAWGKAEFTLLFIRVTAEFNIQVGRKESLPDLPTINVFDELIRELENPTNWSSQLPAGESPLVTFRSEPVSSLDSTGTPPPKNVLVHPLAELQVTQRLVPLEVTITRYGNTTPEGDTTFRLTAEVATGVEGPSLSVQSVSDWFALAQFYDMSDAEKLSAPSFEEMPSGKRFKGPAGYDCGTPVPCGIPLATRLGQQPQAVPAPVQMFKPMAAWGAAGSAATRSTGPAKYRDPSLLHQGVTLKPARYRLEGTPDEEALAMVGKLVSEPSLSYSAARVQADRARRTNPNSRLWMVPALGSERG